ncbi:translation initiation factor IF-2-like [Nycticebus coucang]|uniref:translation initiation factor IF-2-like n=1 Tax=Nycticebus coucang TaxID=9470 RepID=UPI00234C57F1|nr:translation initiation factor IF-2-like [Nycticebus coucang]
MATHSSRLNALCRGERETTPEQQRGAAAVRSSGPQDRLPSPRGAKNPCLTLTRPGQRRGRRSVPARVVRRPCSPSERTRPPPARSQPQPGTRPGAGKPRAGRAGPAGEGEGTWRGYLGSGGGEGSPFSRRCSSADAQGLPLPPAARSAPRSPPQGVRARPPLLGAAPLPARAAPRRRRVSLAGRPAPLTRSHPLGGSKAKWRTARASRGERVGANAGSATRAAPLPQRRRRPGPCCCCQLVERTLSMRARRPHPGCEFTENRRFFLPSFSECLTRGLHTARVRQCLLNGGERQSMKQGRQIWDQTRKKDMLRNELHSGSDSTGPSQDGASAAMLAATCSDCILEAHLHQERG